MLNNNEEKNHDPTNIKYKSVFQRIRQVFFFFSFFAFQVGATTIRFMDY